MATGQLSKVIGHLRRVLDAPDVAVATDGELLKRYVRNKGDAAFEALLGRHGPLVMGVCRRILRNEADAEDAFQATFLVLVRKASTVRSPDLVSNWLYGVAYRTALEARKAAAKRRVKEAKVAPRTETPEDTWTNLLPVLDQELERLPEKYRAAVVLCDLEGKTYQETARQLGWPEGTVASRLARARAMLAKRIARHGLTLSGGAVAAVLSPGVASATVPASVAVVTIRAARRFALGKTISGVASAKVVALTQGVLKTMLLTKLKSATVLLLAAAAAIGACFLTHQALFAQPSDEREDPGATLAVSERSTLPVKIVWIERTTIGMREGDQPLALAISPHGDKIATGHVGEGRLWDTATKRLVGTLNLREMTCLAFSPNGKFIAGGNQNQENLVKLWDAATGQELARLKGHRNCIHALAFSPDGKILATGSNDEIGTVRLWEVAPGRELPTQVKCTERVFALAFSQDGQTLFAALPGGTIKLWNVMTGEELPGGVGHTDRAVSAALSPDGETLALVCRDGTAKLFDVVSGRERGSLPCHSKKCHLAISPDGLTLATAGHNDDRTISLWDLRGLDVAKSTEGGEVGRARAAPAGRRPVFHSSRGRRGHRRDRAGGDTGADRDTERPRTFSSGGCREGPGCTRPESQERGHRADWGAGGQPCPRPG
jgi:RNA polymerase sigma factor (sigma-70 family)